MWQRRTSKNKFGNKKTIIDNITFDSKLEARRFAELKLLKAAKKIDCLLAHPTYQITIGGTKICKVELDFGYRDLESNKFILEDTKGFYTPISRLKHKLFRACYPDLELRIMT